jgi:O-antigen/teichoic acid export membrane protein
VIAVGIACPALRTVDVVFVGWLLGNLAFLAVTFWVFRGLPWKALTDIAVDVQWIRRGLKVSAPIWLGTMGLSASTYIDRFVVAHFLDLEKVGVVTFYFSFASAIFTLVQAGVLSFIYPRLVALHREGNTDGRHLQCRSAPWKTSYRLRAYNISCRRVLRIGADGGQSDLPK